MKRIATWNPARGVWETEQAAICGHSAPFSETWPTSGMTRAGVAYEPPTSEHHTAASASSSLLPTPDVPTGGEQIPTDATLVGNTWIRADGTGKTAGE